MPDVEVARATSLAQVVSILCKTTRAARGEVFLRLINRFRVGVSGTEGQSLTEPLLERQLSSMIIGVAPIIAIFDGAKTWIRNNRLQGAVDDSIHNGAIGIEGGLVQIFERGQMCAFSANVVESRHHITGEHPLNPNVPLIYAGINRFRIDCAKANRDGIDEVGIKREVEAGLESRSEESRVGKECRSRWSPYH